ncbi:MAG: serine/threonine-protein kinase, partial [Pseudomonadota bacterium]
MNDDDQRLLENAFATAVDLDGAARSAFLAKFSQEHERLGHQLTALLRADAGGGETIQSSINDAVAGLVSAFSDPWVGRSLGAYTIKKRLGTGGMGSVFLADRTDEIYAQSVAIKIMSTQLLSPSSVDRFKAERQILASLDHPNIATLIDGGSTDEQVPYLVMQYIDGVSVDKFCDDQRLNIVDRIKLFQKVCDAVDYAHRNLVVHRDLKPSNILVDKDGIPKLLDFGIARLIDPDADYNAGLTAADSRVLTLDYASPEQVRNDPITVASDVYSLGVLLFRLFVGASPYGDNGLGLRALEAAVLDQEPLKPSLALLKGSQPPTGSADDLTGAQGVSEKRSTTMPRLRQALAGDLDNIVTTCLQKEPDRRYASARALADDLERFLTNQPVQAHGDDWVYKARKFAVRQAKPLAAAAAVIAGLVGLNAYYTGQLTIERNQAIQAAIDARRAATRSNEVSNFLTGLFESASPVRAQGEEITAVDLLDAGVVDINQLTEQPILQAELLRVMGTSYSSIGDRSSSLALLDRSVALLESDPDVDPRFFAETLGLYAGALRVAARYEEAEAQARRALQLHEDGTVNDRALYGQTLGLLGSTLNDVGRFGEAETVLLEARVLLEVEGQPPTNTLLSVLGDYGNTLSTTGRTVEALVIDQDVAAVSDAVVGPLHPDTIVRHSNIAASALRIGSYPLADEYAQIALERGRQTWTSENPQLMRHMALAAFTASYMGRFDEALALCEEAVSLLRESQWEDTIHYVVSQRALGAIRTKAGDPEGGYQALKPLLDATSTMLGQEHYMVYAVKNALGEALLSLGRFDDSEAILRSVVANRDSLPSSIHRVAQQSLASLLSQTGRYNEADDLFAPLLANLDDPSGEDGAIPILLLTDASASYRRSGDVSLAVSLADRAIAWGRTNYPENHYMIARALGEKALSQAQF